MQQASLLHFSVYKYFMSYFPLTSTDKTLLQRFIELFEAYPRYTAIQFEEQKVTFEQLSKQSQLFVNFFTKVLSTQQTPVPVLVKSQKEIIPLLIGIVNSGHMYSVIFANDPLQRIKSVLRDLDAPFLIIQDKSLISLAKEASPARTKILTANEAQSETISPIKVDLTSDSNAVIIYTSGSTGEPKGILRTHRMILHQSLTYQDQFGLGPNHSMLGIRPYSAAASLSELFVPLLNGAAVVPFDIKEDGLGKLAYILKSQKISFLRPPIQVLRTFLETLPETEMFPHIRYIFATGDVFYRKDVEKLRRFLSKEGTIIHQFAMSEAGILAVNRIAHDSPLDSDVIPIGKPVKGKELYLQDEDGNPTPHGEIGEVFVRASMKLPGYWRNSEKTNNNFVHDEQTGITTFATGDLGRVRADGQFELIGRKDWRVKILGFSVDLAAIEHVLMESPDVKRAVVLALTDPVGQKRLVAYVLPVMDVVINKKDLLNLVSQNLPSYMIPSFIIEVPDMSIGYAGKVDRKALPSPNWDERQLFGDFIAPKDGLEKQLADIWAKVLKIQQVDRNDNFFELGGDSLMALEMVLEVEKATKKTIPQIFFRSPTIASLAELLQTKVSNDVEKDFFSLKSNEKKSVKQKKKNRFNFTTIKKMIQHGRIFSYIDKTIDFLVARYVVNKTYLEARDWSVRWGQNPIALKLFYRHKKNLLLKVQHSFSDAVPITPEIMQMSITTNMNYGMSRYYDKAQRYTLGKVGALKNSKYKYWQSLADLIQQTPEDELLKFFPMYGFEHVTQAYQEGKGVILITAHSISSPIRLYVASRLLNAEIPTISYRVPIRLSEHHETPKDLPDVVALPMNSEIALFGQRLLMQGRAINIVSDTSDPYGKSKNLLLGNIKYRIKTGFAELALNTGAKVIPYFGGCLIDGRPELNFMPPFSTGSGDRTTQIENLVSQYASFLNYVWSNRPEVLHWRRIAKYLSK